MIEFIKRAQPGGRAVSLLLSCLVFCCLAALGFGQIGGGSGGAWGGDTNPWNPQNWDTSYYVSFQGLDTVTSWKLDQNGQPVEDVKVYDWNGVYLNFPAGASNTTGIAETVSWASVGTTRRYIKWIGIGPAPSKVLVRISSGSAFHSGNVASGAADNGIGTPTVLQAGPDDSLFGQSSGSRLQYLSIDNNGVGVIELPKSATGSSTGVGSYAWANAKDFSIAIADRAVTIRPWVSPTYAPGPQDMPVSVKNPDPTDMRMMVGVRTVTEDALYNCTGQLIGDLWGPWVGPQFSWNPPTPFGATQDTTVVDEMFTNVQVADIANNGPRVLETSVLVVDADGVSRSANCQISIFAQQQWPCMTASVRTYDDWRRVSEIVHRQPGGDLTLTNSIAYAEAVTKQISVNGGASLSKFSPLVISLNIQGQYGVTATVTETNTISYKINSGPDDTLYWIEKRNFWRIDSGFHYMYGPDGYGGLGNHAYKRWESGTKEAAEKVDHEVRLHAEPIP